VQEDNERNDVEIIDVDRLEQDRSVRYRGGSQERTSTHTCIGISITFPPGQNHHTSYPFGLHQQRILPWDYHSVNDRFYVQSKDCARQVLPSSANDETSQKACTACEGLRENNIYAGIVDRIHEGAHENTPLMYHPIGGLVEIVRRKINHINQLQLTTLNQTRKLTGKAATLDDHKQWILAVASGRADRVAALVQAGIKRKAGVRGLIADYELAAKRLYKPKSYSKEEIMKSIVMLRLGGSRVAEFAHHALALPSVTVARRNTVLRPLQVSPSWPTIAEVEANIKSCLEPLSHMPVKVRHQVLMLDEIAIEKRPRWDDRTNMILGVCREHSKAIPLEFNTEKELDLLCDGLDNGSIHLASEV